MPRYLWATLNELIHLRDWSLEVRSDGQLVHQGAALFASSLNTPTFGSGIPAVPHARMDDGQLNVLWSGPFSRPGALTMLPRLLMGWHLSHPRIATRAFERRFQLADHVQVRGAHLENGMLSISLVREVPEAMKPRRIEIGSSNVASLIDATEARQAA